MARYWITFLVFSVLPAPDSPLGREGRKRRETGRETGRDIKRKRSGGREGGREGREGREGGREGGEGGETRVGVHTTDMP